tara:strand:- start:10 stop:1035 length:1026 start_codon:yes stop_codon:yes gene_type:complete
MSSVWFRDLGFYSNPFSIKPAAFHDQVIGYDKVIDEVSYGILNNKVIVLDGDYGNGKSSILRRLLNDFGGKKQVIYYSCNRMEARLNMKSLLNGRYGFFGKMFDIKPKDMILLLDEAQELGEKDYQKLYSYYQEGYLKSIVLVGKNIETKRILAELHKNLKEVSLDKIDESTAVKVIRKRIGDLNLLPDAMVKKIFALSKNNVRLLLKNCEEACRYAVQTGRKAVNDDVIAYVFGDKKETPAKKKAEKIEKKVEKKAEKKEEKAKAEKKKAAPKKAEKKTEKKASPKKEEKKPEPVAEEKEIEVPAPAAKENVYHPEDYKDMLQSSAEELLSSTTDDMFRD